MYEVHFFTLPYYFGYSLRYFSSQKMWLLFHDALQQSFWTYSLQVPIKSHLHLQIPNQLIPRLCKRTIYTSYTILSIWSIYIINNWCLPPTWFVFVFFFVYILHLQLVVPPSTRLYYCIINGAFSSHYMTWKKNYFNTIELFRFVILQINFYKASKNWLPNRRKKILYPCASFSDHMILYLAKE